MEITVVEGDVKKLTRHAARVTSGFSLLVGLSRSATKKREKDMYWQIRDLKQWVDGQRRCAASNGRMNVGLPSSRKWKKNADEAREFSPYCLIRELRSSLLFCVDRFGMDRY